MVFAAKAHPRIPTKDILSWIFDAPNYDLDKPILIDPSDPSRSISHNQAKKLICKLASGLRKAGLEKGDCVNIHCFNDIYYPILFLGVVAAGGVFAGTNPAYTEFKVTHHLKTANAKFAISESQIVAPVLAAAKAIGMPVSNMWIFNESDPHLPPGMKSWRSLLQAGHGDAVRFEGLEIAKNTGAAIFFSSGTTGLPKAALLSHYNIVAQHTLVYDMHPTSFEVIRLVPLPLFHVAAALMTHTSALKNGIQTYIMCRFDLAKFVEYIQRYRVSDLVLVPPIAVALVNAPIATKSAFRTIRLARCGAAPLDKSLQSMLRKKLPADAPFTQGFGMTEISCLGLMTLYPEDDDTGSIGRLIPGLEAKLVDEAEKDVSAHDVRGELCLRGPTVISGYFNNPDANREAFDSEGWFRTGDIAYCAAGTEKWYIVDRKKDLIKVRGFQVAPPEIEGVLMAHSEITEAAVIGVALPDQGGEHPRAYVVRAGGTDGSKGLTEEEVKSFVGSRLAK
ncbi:hypothetical protein BJY01DRAFT_261280 [Aspergillus pseudoustus]|uniref:AMP-dependent synthetase/ligase domain-containing protein n=1 Tax=Aspergillus pseudoustus TaxID=1810923 RepID=A0ABR4INL9_9EURO